LVNRTFISSYEKIVGASEEKLKRLLVSKGPVISLINDQGDEFLQYKSGILPADTKEPIEKPNHALLIIGWGSIAQEDADNGTSLEFWIVKNSWGTRWGESGYARIEFGARGLGRYVYYPVLFGGAQDRREDLYKSLIMYGKSGSPIYWSKR